MQIILAMSYGIVADNGVSVRDTEVQLSFEKFGYILGAYMKTVSIISFQK